MYEAARKGDQIEHSAALAGLLAGVAIGAVVGALTVATGGAAAVAIAAMGAASTGGFLGQIAGGFLKHKAGPIATGARKVKIGGKPAARAKIDQVDCHKGTLIAQGSRTVIIENFPASRVDDKTACDGKIAEGFATVKIGKEPGTYVEIGSEVPWWLEVGVMLLGFPELILQAGKLAIRGVKLLKEGGLTFLKNIPSKLKGSVSRIKEILKYCIKDPVDVATGDVVDETTDLSLPGMIPVTWKRSYCSAQASEETSLGLGGWTHSFEQWVVEDGDLWTLRTDGGRDIYFEKIAPGEATFHRRERLTLTAEGEGRFSVYSLDTRLTRTFSPIEEGGKALLRSIRDAHGNEVALYYDGEQLARVVDTAGRELHVQSDSLGRVMRVEVWARGELQQWVDYSFHPSGELARVINALGHSELFEYDPAHRIAKATLPNGVNFYWAYDPENGRCVRTWGDGGLHTGEFTYDLELGKTIVRGTGEPRVYYWNDFGMVLREETLDGQCLRTLEVDDDGYVLAEGTTEVELTRYAYDARGNRTQVTDAAGNVTLWEYASDRPTQRIGPDGLVTSYAHDAYGALGTVNYPSGVRYLLGYDLHGRLTTVRDGDRAVASFAYDGEHNVVREVDARGAETGYTYDPLNRPIARTDALGRVTRVEYDRLGQPIALHTADGAVTRAEYDARGNVTRSIDALGQVTEMEYAGTGVLSRLVQPDGCAWSMRYDLEERITEIRNPHGELYAFSYNETGRVGSERTFDGRTLRYEYSEEGRLSSIEQPDGLLRLFRYDPLGNILGDRAMDSTITFERDKLGRLTNATLHERSGKVVVDFKRDHLGRVVEEAQNGKTLRYAYDAHGMRTERVLPDGSTTRYGYDAAGDLAYVEHDGRRFALDRDALGREVARRAEGGGIEIRNAYDEMDRLVARNVAGGPAHAALSGRTWKYDALGRVREIGDGRWGTTQYQYDRIGQLIEAKRGAYHEVFQYDITGSLRNILSGLTPGGNARPWDTEPGNLLTRTETARYEYDKRGRRVKKIALLDAKEGSERAGDVTEYVWDEYDRMREVKKPDGDRVLFTYDAFSRRVRKEVLAGEEQAGRRVVEFLWDGNELAADVDSRRGARVFVHEPGTFVPMLQVEQGEVFAVVNDHLGMPKELIDQDGRVAWSAAHSAWGRVVEEYVDPLAPRKLLVKSPFRLLGQYADEDIGLCCTRFRYFDAQVGRWCSSDPLGIAGGLNLQQFDGVPTVDVDPQGLCVTSIYRAFTSRGAPSTFDVLSSAASRALAKVGIGKGPVYGTLAHTAFRNEVEALGLKNLSTEVSYLNGKVVSYGTKGSVRLDVVEGPLLNPTAVFDFKTGGASLSATRIQQIQSHLPLSAKNIPIIEVR